MDYPYGKAAFWILVLAVGSAIALAFWRGQEDAGNPDLVFVTYSSEHALAYIPAIRNFEREHHVKISLQIVDLAALQERLKAALEVKAAVPDMVEFGVVLMGSVMRGPIADIGFEDLTEKIREAHLDQRLVASRFSGFESEGHIFALPHDVHPVMLAYRRDLVEQLGIDVNKLTTWDEFVRVGRQVTRDLNGDGVIDRFMIDLPDDTQTGVEIALLQQGQSHFDAQGRVAFDTELTVNTICWYVRQTEGPTRISFNCRSGQDLARAISDGLCLFYICPDWRSMQFTLDVPSMAGKIALMPLPAFTAGGRRTSTWGATGLAITKACRKKDLAWDLAMYLYYDPEKLAQRWKDTRILPPLRAAWALPAYSKPDPYFSNQPIGRMYADLAPTVPAKYSNPYTNLAETKIADAYIATKLYYREHGDAGLADYCRRQVHTAAEAVEKVQRRNVLGRQP